MPSPMKQIPRPLSKLRIPMEQDLDFIKAGCHLSAFVTAAVNTLVEQAIIQVLWGDLELAFSQINVSPWIRSCLFFLAPNRLSFAENL
jgi:hypothetical protein